MHNAQTNCFLASRQALVLAFDNLIARRPFQKMNESLSKDLALLCESLVDYLSLGHFSYFESLNANLDRVQINLLIENTQRALDFNDKYQDRYSISTLEHDLSQLIHLLAARFDWEDALIFKHEGRIQTGRAA